ncbi:MAG: LytTR family DNA-binding domain-containing protein [Flavobacteriales bacterium]|nr:LytTR family DNA-binding domain-containing protein [Flavobacteriales bacterium]
MYRFLILDDEHFSRENLASHLQILGYECDIVKCKSIAEAKAVLDKQPIDIIFLDINLESEFGFDLLKVNEYAERIPVIIVSGHNEYGILAVKSGVIDYVLKPILLEELKNAVDKAIQEISDKSNSTNLITKKNKIVIINKGSFSVFELSNVIYFEAEGNYTKIKINGNDDILASKTLKTFENQFSHHPFFRVSRSLLVNLDYMKGYKSQNNKKFIHLSNDELKEISNNRWDEFISYIKKNYNVF